MLLATVYDSVYQAAMAVFDDKHQNAPDCPTDDEDDHKHVSATDLKGKGKAKEIVRAPVSFDIVSRNIRLMRLSTA